jgi:hypothetical protein
MKRVTLLLTGIVGLALNGTLAADAPYGSLLELHSCQLYAGGCVVSSEITQEGHYMLRAWDFAGGDCQGVALAGLQVAVLQSSPDNLAVPGSKSGEAVVYLPRSATQVQRDALLAWLKTGLTDFHPTAIHTRVVPLQFEKSQTGYRFSAGEFVSVRTDPFDACPVGNCNESLWYSPRSATSLFTVAVDHSSTITEPLLKLRWDENFGDHRVFLARFGKPDAANHLYVSMTELCGASKSLF